MDAVHYEKIADALMQFRGKLPKDGTLSDKKAEFTVDHMKIQIDSLLSTIDIFADLDDKGWIR